MSQADNDSHRGGHKKKLVGQKRVNCVDENLEEKFRYLTINELDQDMQSGASDADADHKETN